MPLWAGWTVALLAASGFAALGTWQAGRAVEKERLLADTADVLSARRGVPASAAFDPARSRATDWVEMRARFPAHPAILLDNQQRDGRVGIRVYRIAQLDTGGDVLVDFGWLPLPGDRRLPPLAPPPAGLHALRGLLVPPPSAGLPLGPAMAMQGDGPARAWLATRIDIAAIDAALGDPQRPLAPRVLRLDPALPMGHARDLRLLANTLPPEKHRGYALQWFGLSATVLVIALVLTFRKSRR